MSLREALPHVACNRFSVCNAMHLYALHAKQSAKTHVRCTYKQLLIMRDVLKAWMCVDQRASCESPCRRCAYNNSNCILTFHAHGKALPTWECMRFRSLDSWPGPTQTMRNDLWWRIRLARWFMYTCAAMTFHYNRYCQFIRFKVYWWPNLLQISSFLTLGWLFRNACFFVQIESSWQFLQATRHTYLYTSMSMTAVWKTSFGFYLPGLRFDGTQYTL